MSDEVTVTVDSDDSTDAPPVVVVESDNDAPSCCVHCAEHASRIGALEVRQEVTAEVAEEAAESAEEAERVADVALDVAVTTPDIAVESEPVAEENVSVEEEEEIAEDNPPHKLPFTHRPLAALFGGDD